MKYRLTPDCKQTYTIYTSIKVFGTVNKWIHDLHQCKFGALALPMLSTTAVNGQIVSQTFWYTRIYVHLPALCFRAFLNRQLTCAKKAWPPSTPHSLFPCLDWVEATLDSLCSRDVANGRTVVPSAILDSTQSVFWNGAKHSFYCTICAHSRLYTSLSIMFEPPVPLNGKKTAFWMIF
jgi:hypothetical protein